MALTVDVGRGADASPLTGGAAGATTPGGGAFTVTAADAGESEATRTGGSTTSGRGAFTVTVAGAGVPEAACTGGSTTPEREARAVAAGAGVAEVGIASVSESSKHGMKGWGRRIDTPRSNGLATVEARAVMGCTEE
ncbi:hypothetical protein [Myxococcus sp. CA039A]|uniref:hypothetical protein n=1 Tax=Myxococcus sp. CA039A TaxID=2741737 RepID=UPI00157B7C8F|nr:hypothetical protein [Myxococcus sp. CA039A]